MYDFILQVTAVVSLGVVIFVLTRAVPRIGEISPGGNRALDQIDQLIAKIPLDKADAMLNSFLGKILRRIRLVIMRVDNFVNEKITRLKRTERAIHPVDQIEKNEDNK
jgi:hypothetical protein